MSALISNIQRIEFLATRRCNSRCSHCYASLNNDQPRCIDAERAANLVEQVAQTYSVESVMTFGGEPLLCWDSVIAIHRAATKAQIPSRQIITNGFWHQNANVVSHIAEQLQQNGVNWIGFSVDVFHQKWIPLDMVRHSAQACLNQSIEHIEWIPSWVVDPQADNKFNTQTRIILHALADLDIPIGWGNIVEPVKTADSELQAFFPPKTHVVTGRCGEMPYTSALDAITDICITPDGQVDICWNLSIGNAWKTDILSILENYDPQHFPIIKRLHEEGVAGLMRWARQYIAIDPEGYYNACDACRKIRRALTNIEKT